MLILLFSGDESVGRHDTSSEVTNLMNGNRSDCLMKHWSDSFLKVAVFCSSMLVVCHIVVALLSLRALMSNDQFTCTCVRLSPVLIIKITHSTRFMSRGDIDSSIQEMVVFF